MSKNNTDTPDNCNLVEASKIKNDYIESLKDQIQMLQEQIKATQVQHEAAQNRLMSMFEQTQRLIEHG